jgi:hypothetical protein
MFAMLGRTVGLAIKKTVGLETIGLGGIARKSGQCQHLFHNPARIWKLFMFNVW